jgi:sporulation protein YlmC with PRC-barrel domain
MTDERILLVSDLVGRRVRRDAGAAVGTLADFVVAVGAEHPAVSGLVLRRGRIDTLVPWGAVAEVGPGGIVVADDADLAPCVLRDNELLLVRDVLDTQVVDLEGKRFARVSDVFLARDGDAVEVFGVDVSPAGVWRRLGLRRRADRMTERPIEWSDLHLTSTRGQTLHLATQTSSVRRLAPAELAALVEHLHPAKAQQVLDTLSPAEVSAVETHRRRHRRHRLHALRPFARVRRRPSAPR